jgi:cytochrome c-type biogenesis protein CcmH
MTWVLAIALALLAFAAAAFVFRLPRHGWTTMAAALALGLAGYALQAHPGLPGAPASPRKLDPQLGAALIESRQAMIKEDARSRSPKLVSADAFARMGRYADAVTFLDGAVADNPRDAEAWLALANALVEHADGALTPPALLAYRRAQEADPTAAGPGYFLGLSLIRQGRMEEASQIWRETLQAAAPDAAGRAQLAALLERLNATLGQSAPHPVARQ